MDTLPPQETALITWNAPVTPHHRRTKRWYIIAAVIIALCVAYGWYVDSIPFAVVAVLVGVIYALLHKHAPPDRTIVLTSEGVTLGRRMAEWSDLAGFWILHTSEYDELHFVSRKPRTADLVIQTGTQSTETLRAILQTRLPELTDRKERILDTFIRICKL